MPTEMVQAPRTMPTLSQSPAHLVASRLTALHTVAIRANEAIGTLIVGDTLFTEEELDAIVALKDALEALPAIAEA